MRKILFIAGVLFLVSNATKAQTTFGVNLGFTTSKMKFNAPTGSVVTDSRRGIYAGVLAEYRVDDGFSIQPEVNFAMAGSNFKSNQYQTKFKLNYINVPVLAVFKLDPFSFYGGPQVSYLLSADGTLKLSENETKYDIKGDFKSIDISALLGVGYDSESGLGADIRFQIGFLNIARKNTTSNFPGLNTNNKTSVNAIQLGAHYKFLKNKKKKKGKKSSK